MLTRKMFSLSPGSSRAAPLSRVSELKLYTCSEHLRQIANTTEFPSIHYIYSRPCVCGWLWVATIKINVSIDVAKSKYDSYVYFL